MAALQLAAEHDPGADSGPDGEDGNVIVPGGGAVAGFRPRCHVGVVVDDGWQPGFLG